VLTLGGALGAGVKQPPPQFLRIPAEYLQPDAISAVAKGRPVSAPGVSLRFAYRAGAFEPPASGNRAIPVALGITAAGWQDRSRTFVERDVRKVKLAPFRNGLRPYVYADPARYKDATGTTELVGEDAEFGFIAVYCSPGTQSCNVNSELTPYLTLSVTIRDSELDQWRAMLAAARGAVRGFVISR
jgi:hypothetical protein